MAVSRDGRLVAFTSAARNLSEADAEEPGRDDVFVHDRANGETSLVSPPGPLSFASTISADGRFVAFATASDAHEPSTIHVRDLRTGSLRVAGRGSTTTGYAYPQAPPAISANGRVVAFESRTRRGGRTLKLRDMRDGRTRTIARTSSGRFSGLSLSLDGRAVAWSHVDDERVSVFRYSGRTRRRAARYRAPCCLVDFGIYGTALSRDGRKLAYTASYRGGSYVPGVFVLDGRTGKRRVVSRASGRRIAGRDPSIDGAGRFITFSAPLRNGGQGIFARDLMRGRTRGVALGARARISANGRWVGYIGTDDPNQAYVTRRP